jgi:8-oxo-dGTP diphosphatase
MTEEKFDELDENQNFMGKQITREAAHINGLWHRAVGLYIVNSKNQVLCQRRSAAKKTWPNCWDYTAGGHVAAGELGVLAAINETREEIGVNLKPEEIRYICGHRSDKKMGNMWDRHHNEYFITFKDIDIKDIKIQESEVAEIKWLDYKDFKKMVLKRDKSLTEKWECHEALVHYMEQKNR